MRDFSNLQPHIAVPRARLKAHSVVVVIVVLRRQRVVLQFVCDFVGLSQQLVIKVVVIHLTGEASVAGELLVAFWVFIELAQEVVVALLGHLYVSGSVVLEEKIAVLSVSLNPDPVLAILEKLLVVLVSVVLLLFSHKLLEVVIVKDVGVHGPTGEGSLLGGAVETKGVHTAHESDVLLGLKVHGLETGRGEGVVELVLSRVVDQVVLFVILEVNTVHLEEHLGATAVLDGSVATKLDEVAKGQFVCNVVALSFEFLHFFEGLLQLDRLSHFDLAFEGSLGS